MHIRRTIVSVVLFTLLAIGVAMDSNYSIFNVAMESLNVLKEECVQRNEMPQRFVKAIVDLSSALQEQKQRTIILKKEIGLLKAEISLKDKKLQSRSDYHDIFNEQNIDSIRVARDAADEYPSPTGVTFDGEEEEEVIRVETATDIPTYQNIPMQVSSEKKRSDVEFKSNYAQDNSLAIRSLTVEEKKLVVPLKGIWFGDDVAETCLKGIQSTKPHHKRDSNGYTPLHIAAAVGEKLTTLILLRCGAHVNEVDLDGNTPLHLAVMKGKYWVANTLLLNQADPHRANNLEETPKQLAMKNTEYAMKELFDDKLLDWFNLLKQPTRDQHYVYEWSKKGYYLGIAIRCADGVDVNIKDPEENQNTALHYAVSSHKNKEETLLTLLRCGADINARNADGDTPLQLSIMNNEVDAMLTLLLKGADPFIENKLGRTAFMVGMESENPTISETFNSNRYKLYIEATLAGNKYF